MSWPRIFDEMAKTEMEAMPGGNDSFPDSDYDRFCCLGAGLGRGLGGGVYDSVEERAIHVKIRRGNEDGEQGSNEKGRMIPLYALVATLVDSEVASLEKSL